MEVVEIPLDQILADHTFNCRGLIDKVKCVELSKDIKEHGQDNPIVVRPIDHAVFKYQVIAGHRRFTAIGMLGWETVRCFIRTDLINEGAARDYNLRENLHREDLTMTQEAHAISYYKGQGFSSQAIADRLGKSTSWVEIRRKLIRLPDFVQKAANEGVVNQTHIQQLWEYRNNPEKMSEIIRKMKQKHEAGERAIAIKEDLSIKDLTKVRRPKPHEIQDFCYELARMITNNIPQEDYLPHRVASWTAGNISLIELYAAVRRECGRLGLPFNPRSDVAKVFEENRKC